jgi:uncharacterized protein
MSRRIRSHPLVAYFVLAYAFTWVPVAIVLVALQLGLVASSSPVVGVTSRLISFGPAIAAVIATAAVGGRAAVGQLLRKLVQWRVGIQWYLVALFGIPIALLAGSIVLFRGAPLTASAGQWQTVILLYLPTVLLAAITIGVGEETGWRGFALPRLQSRHGALVATLILGVLWGLWHLPNVLFFHWGSQTLALFLAETLTDAFILTWVYNNSRGSLLPVVILHAAQDKSFGMLAVLMPNVPTDQLYVLYIVIDFVLLLAIVIYTKGTLSLIRERALPGARAAAE